MVNRRDELDAMYVILSKGCAGMSCTDCPGAEYDHCGDYNKAVMLYDEGWRRVFLQAEWVPITKINKKFGVSVIVGFECSNCNIEQEVATNYCSYCGAKMFERR